MTGRWLSMPTKCNTSTDTDPAWTPAWPAKCSSSTTCGANNAGPITPRRGRPRRAQLAIAGTTVPKAPLPGPLNTYANQPKVFDDTDVELAQDVAAWVAVRSR